MDKRGDQPILVKIIYLILFLMLVFILLYFYQKRLKGGVFRF